MKPQQPIGSAGEFPLPAPIPPYCGSAYGGSWQSLRNDAALFLCHGDRCPAAQPIGFIAPGQDHRWSCLPAKFSPSRVVSRSGIFVFTDQSLAPGSYLPVLWPLLTPAPARRSLLAAAPAITDGLGLQVSLSKDVNYCCTTGPFISGTEHRTVLCRASLSVPSTLYGLSVRRLISFDLRLPSHETSRFRSCLGLMFGPPCLSL